MEHGTISANIAKGIHVLRNRIEQAHIPPSRLDETINIATWNIREFGRKHRKKASIHLIAEILYQFDIIAMVELRDNLYDLERVLQILGPYWRVVYSDFNADAAGNRERMAYIYDKRAVTFTGLASEADPPKKKRTRTVNGKKITEYLPEITWWRSPFMASFRSGNFDFIMLSVHIRWDSKGGETSRIRALEALANWVDKHIKEKHIADKDVILLGDFNIPNIDDPLFRAITSKGLRMPKAMRGTHGSNLAKDKRYDQLLHYPRRTSVFTDRGGVLDFYQSNYKNLLPGIRLSKTEFTYQLSDHLPLWIQLNVDDEDEKLDQLLNR